MSDDIPQIDVPDDNKVMPFPKEEQPGPEMVQTERMEIAQLPLRFEHYMPILRCPSCTSIMSIVFWNEAKQATIRVGAGLYADWNQKLHCPVCGHLGARIQTKDDIPPQAPATPDDAPKIIVPCMDDVLKSEESKQ